MGHLKVFINALTVVLCRALPRAVKNFWISQYFLSSVCNPFRDGLDQLVTSLKLTLSIE